MKSKSNNSHEKEKELVKDNELVNNNEGSASVSIDTVDTIEEEISEKCSESGDTEVSDGDEESSSEESLSEEPELVLLNKRIKTLEEEKKEASEKVARIQAEFENSRRRLREQAKRDREFAKADLLKPFLTVYEEFHQVSEIKIDESTDLKKYHEGITKLYNKFDKVLRDEDLEPFGKEGDVFDPALHQAISVTETDDKEMDQTIQKVLSRGYKIDEFVLKPAMVVIYNV